MPRNQFQRMVFAFITVVITVLAFVFYNIFVLNGDMLRSFNYTSSVLTAVNKQGGIMMFGTMLPIWAVVLVEFAFAYTLEVLVGSPLSFRIASKMFDIKTTSPVIFEGAVITVTVAIMCPAMSFIAAIIYYGSVGMTKEWLLYDNTTSAEVVVEMMFNSMPQKLYSVLM